jgi:uncharacterized membrane protein
VISAHLFQVLVICYRLGENINLLPYTYTLISIKNKVAIIIAMQQTSAPTISLRANIWIVIPIAALIAAILSANFLFLNYVHIFSSILWTGTDIFMAFLLGPVLRNVSLSTRKEVISWLMPKMVFFMPTVSAVTTTAGYFLASKMGLITLQPPTVYWISAVLIIVAAMMIQGLGILLPTNLRVYYELRKSESDMSKIQKLMRRYVQVVAIQAALQFTIIFIMAEFATGFSLRL